ncbi:uncharacterized protein LOC119512080 [Choloepus didactylus]|uniref:uncharacterized protein LOC119512080 n=1 Tax=Choloepus didactylus TaxID=27675 RepID=UPI00189E635D|nr:uncharacterized protein LOC119512080 [Choloepus didactylus]
MGILEPQKRGRRARLKESAAEDPGRRGGAPTFGKLRGDRAALKVDSNFPRGGKRRRSPSRKAAKKYDAEDTESRSSGSHTNCFGFVAYSVNSGEKSRVKIKTLTHQPAYPSTTRSEHSPCPTPSPSPSPTASTSPAPVPSLSPSPTPGKLRCLDQRESENEERREPKSKKRRRNEGDPIDMVNHLWLGFEVWILAWGSLGSTPELEDRERPRGYYQEVGLFSSEHLLKSLEKVIRFLQPNVIRRFFSCNIKIIVTYCVIIQCTISCSQYHHIVVHSLP